MNLEILARDFPEHIGRLVRTLSGELKARTVHQLETALKARTPVGATGRLAQSLGVSGDEVGFSDVKAIGLNPGRKKSKPFSRTTPRGGKSIEFSRRLGSKSQPRGMTRGAIRELRRVWPDVVKEAIAASSGGGQ
jgi:hypothetical protein